MNTRSLAAGQRLAMVGRTLILLAACASAAEKTWMGDGGDGLWSNAANWSDGVPVAGDVAVFDAVGGAVNVDASTTLQRIRVLGSSAVTLAIADGATLTFSNAGGAGLDAVGADLVIDGPGVLTFSTGGGENHLDNGANAGRALVFNAKITGATGFEAWRASADIPGGTIVMGHPENDFTLNFSANGGHTIVASKLASAGQPSSLGAGSNVYFSYYGTLRYTGDGDSTDRMFLLNGGSASVGIGGRVEHAGSGPLTLSGPVRNNSNAAQTLVLLGSSASEARITGPVYNNTGTLAVLKEGSGTWVLAGSNTFSGGLTLKAGTLGLAATNAAGTGALTLQGGTLAVNPDADPTFTAVTLPGLSPSCTAAAITAPAGTTVFVNGLAEGTVGPWLTFNGQPATYSAAAGLAVVAVTTANLATKGSTLPNGDTIEAVIDTVGTGADIALPADSTRLYSLTQTVPDDAATVDTAGKTLIVPSVAVASGAAALTIGALPKSGALLPPVVSTGVTVPDSSDIAALEPKIWYDPSETATVTLFAGTITAMANKGTAGSALDAVVRAGQAAPFYVDGAASFAALPMVNVAADNQQLQSAANSGISGNAPRTLIAVIAFNPSQQTLVSLGIGNTSQNFALWPRSDLVRFNLWSGDIDMKPAPAGGTPHVYSMMNGIGGDNNTVQGWFDGATTNTLTKSPLNTADTPLCIGHLNGGYNSAYRGQIGEILLFDKVLTDTERQTVEAYLTAKWMQPKPVLPSGTSNATGLTLRNDSVLAPLTVNAAVGAPAYNTVSINKTGAGTAVLAGGVSVNGPVSIAEGALTVNSPAEAGDIFSAPVSGSGMLVKGGDGLLRLPYTVANTYAGGTLVTGGILRVGNNASLGSGPVTVLDGGTVDIGDNPSVNTAVSTTDFFIEGAGFNGQGALVNNGVDQMEFIKGVVTLTDNATVGGNTAARWDIRAKNMNFDGHVLTKTGLADMRFSGGGITNAPAGIAAVINGGVLGLENSQVHPNAPGSILSIGPAGTFGIYNRATPFNWTLQPADGATIWAYGNDAATNRNILTSDLALPGTLNLTAAGSFGKNLTGLISGPGGLSVFNGGAQAVSLLSHPANTFEGLVTVSNAVLGLRHPGSLPDVAKLTVKNAGGVRVYPYGSGWTDADVAALAGSGAFVSNSRLQFDVAAGETAALGCAIGAPFAGMLDKCGAGELALNGDVTLANHARIYAGTLTLTNAAVFSLGNFGLYAGDALNAPNGLIVGGSAKLLAADRGSGVNAAGIWVGTHGSAKSLMEVKGNAQVYGKLMVGGSDPGNDNNAVGAVYMSGNTRWDYPAGNGNDGMIGKFGYGYLNLGGGVMDINGGTQFGVVRTNTTSVGIFHQTDGFLNFRQNYGGTFAFSRGGVGVAQIEGGKAVIAGQLELLDNYNNDGEGGNNIYGGTAIFTVTDGADFTTSAEVLFGNRSNAAGYPATAYLNLNGGKLTTTYLRRANTVATCAVNFNGGVLCVTNNGGSAKLISLDNAANQLDACVYAGGAKIDLGEGVTRTLDVPLQRGAGNNGITRIPVTAGGSGYIAPPYVKITGGGGAGATAFARIDRAAGAVTAIDITCPGYGYTSSPTVTLIGGGGSGVSLGTPEIRPAADGGLTKTGPGTLILNAVNAYRGPTIVEGGFLKLGRSDAIDPASGIVIGDGTLDLNGFTVTNRSATVTGSGSIVNGRVVTASVFKNGSGTAMWDADLTFAEIGYDAVPGLWEGFLEGEANLTDPNPRTDIKLGTVAAQTSSSAIWGTYRTGVYTGTIWNREDHDVTWTFAKNFDDTAHVYIDGTLRALSANSWSAIGLVTVTLTPGPHAFEVRFGQGTGGAGPNVAGWGSLGFGIDFQGRGEATPANFVPAADPGDGSLFTASLPVQTPDDRIRVAEGTLCLPPRQPGWYQGTIDHGGLATAARNLTAPNPRTAVVLASDQANSRTRLDDGARWSIGAAWPTNLTECYSGYIWNRTDANVNWTLYKNFDDTIDLWLDGVSVAVTGGNSWDAIGLMQLTLTPGPHSLEVRFGQSGGGAGPTTAAAIVAAGWPADVALGIDTQGRNTAVKENFVKLQDPGDGSLLTCTPYSGDTGTLSGVTVDVADGAVLDLGGIPRDGLTVSGEGTVINSAGGAGNVLSPSGDGRTGAMSLSGASLAGATYRLTVHDPNPNAPGLWEGVIESMPWTMALDVPHPKTSVQLTTRAGNGAIGPKTTYAGGLWNLAAVTNTYVYSGTLWVRSPTNVIWTWRFSFDDNIALWLDGKLVRYVGLASGTQWQNVMMTPGPHAFEVRYGDNGGNIGPSGSITAGGIGGLAYDPLGRGPSSEQANFLLLEDSGDGSVLSLTADAFGYACDVITSAGALDLTGLTVMPSDAQSAEPPGREYVILRAEGGLTGTAVCEGFTNKKWMVLKRGNDLLLTTAGGSIMVLK